MMNDAMFFVRTWKKKSARERMCVISLIRNPALQRTNKTGEGKEEALSISHPRPSKPKRAATAWAVGSRTSASRTRMNCTFQVDRLSRPMSPLASLWMRFTNLGEALRAPSSIRQEETRLGCI